MMKLQELIIKKNKNFELKDIFDCGQCFRWNQNNDGSYTGVIKNGVLNVKCDEINIYFRGLLDGNIKEIVYFYFDLNKKYSDFISRLSNIDNFMKQSIEFGKGIRILNQDLFETIISFIISANNNIPRIKGIIERMSVKYGTEVLFENCKYYLFPTPEQLQYATVDDFRALGLGFRDIRIFETIHMILNNKNFLSDLFLMNTEEAKTQLLNLSGVGPKVADCILLFSELKRFDVFPIDVWVRRVMNELYIGLEDESKVSKKQIYDLAEEKFGDLKGIAQQYLFYWKRSMDTKEGK